MLVALFARLPWWLKQKVCGWLAPGHSYTMEMIRMEDNSYVLDPFTECRHCALALPETIYTKLIASIDDEVYEDEAW